MLQWLEQELKVSSNAFRKLKADTAKLEALRPRPTLAVAQANVAALEEVLHMSRPQVHLRSSCCWCNTHVQLRFECALRCTAPPVRDLD